MNRARTLVVMVLALSLLGAATVSVSGAQAQVVIPPDSVVQGLTYGEWAARYFEWVFAYPASANPAFGMADTCITQKIGQVSMVAFNPLPTGPLDCGAITSRTQLFVLAPVGLECSMVEPYPFYGADEAGLNACVDGFSWSGLTWSLDGVPIEVSSDYIVRSPMYKLRWGEDNALGMPEPGKTWSVVRAPFLMFAPLAPGKHTIELHGVLADPDGSPFAGDATLLVTVE